MAVKEVWRGCSVVGAWSLRPDLLPILLDNVQGDNSLLTQPHQFLEPPGRIPAPSTTPSSTRLRMPTDPQGGLQDYNSRIGMRKLAPGMSGKEEQ
jgi:hypothetical protein